MGELIMVIYRKAFKIPIVATIHGWEPDIPFPLPPGTVLAADNYDYVNKVCRIIVASRKKALTDLPSQLMEILTNLRAKVEQEENAIIRQAKLAALDMAEIKIKQIQPIPDAAPKKMFVINGESE